MPSKFEVNHVKAVLQNVKTGVVSVEEVPRPILKPGNVLVSNHCSLVSAGTEKAVLEFSKANYLEKARKRPDLVRKVLNKAKNDGLWQTYKVVSNLIDQPIALGYSTAGTVLEVGSEVTDIRVGQRVACAGLFVATHSEIVSVPRNLLVPIPDNVDFEDASFVTLGAIALQGVRLADLSLSENVVVYGLGLVGMITAQLAIAAGARVIGIDLDPAKVAKVRGYGGIGVQANPGFEKEVLALTKGYGADKVLLCAATTSNQPIEVIPEFTRQKGLLVVVGDVLMNVPRRAYYDKEIDIRISRSYGPGRYDYSYEDGGVDYPYAYVRWTENRNMEAIIDLIARERLDVKSLLTHRFNIDDALKAYEIIEGRVREPYMGMAINYPQREQAAAVSVIRAPIKPSASAGVGGGVGANVKTSNRESLTCGLIGAGQFAKAFLLPAFADQKGVRFKSVCTASGVSAASVAKKYDSEIATSDPHQIFADESLDAVVISTRHDSHARYVLKGLDAGKAIYVEKPLATTLEDLEAIRAKVNEQRAAGKNPYLMVGFNRRFSPLAKLLKDTFAPIREPKSIIYRVNAGFIPNTEWVHDAVAGGGRLIGEGCHFVDFVSYLTGSTLASVYCTALQKEGKPVLDCFSLNLEYEDGSMGTIHYFSNGNTSMAKEYVEVFSGGVSAQLQNFRKVEIHGAKAKGKSSYMNQVKGFEQEAEAFVSNWRSGLPAPIEFESLYQTTQATLVAQESLRAGCRIVL